jgi:hypothetical protein
MNRVNSIIALVLVAAAVTGFFMGKLDTQYFESIVSVAVGFFFGGLTNQPPTPKVS